MPSSGKDYQKSYQLQDRFLQWWATLALPFYLSGGTALGRYYLGHRYSEDLDFFVNADPGYPSHISYLYQEMGAHFDLDPAQFLFTNDYTRFFIRDQEAFLKIELVNDVAYRSGAPFHMPFGLLDTPANILSNKLSALMGRDEPKDLFDIVQLAAHYDFSWMEVFLEAKKKAVLNEIELEARLIRFPIESLENADWMMRPIDWVLFRDQVGKIADDFLLGRDNSLGNGKTRLAEARPLQVK